MILGPLSLSGINPLLGSTADSKVHITYHWHLHQPLYWPAPLKPGGPVQTALQSIQNKAQGGGLYPGSPVPHPENRLAEGDVGAYDPVFTKEDRVRIYQERGFDSLKALSVYPNAGVQISYTGSLIENIKSFGESQTYGYRHHWAQGYQDASRMTTQQGQPRADLVGITFHHGLAPLLPRAVFRKELLLQQETQRQQWGRVSQGFFPPELAFSKEMIPELKAAGYQWSFVPAHHIARATANYLEVAPEPSSSTWNTDPPNKSDLQNPAVPKPQWWSGTLDGRGATLPVPLAYMPHHAIYTDPSSGNQESLIIVPADDILGYQDGYGTMGTDSIDRFLAPFAKETSRPLLVVMAHDGDNAWGGGYSYYFESVPQFAQAATARGYQMTTVASYLKQNPVPLDAQVHVEDGSWVNPEGDFGGPAFAKWLFPPMRSPSDPQYKETDPKSYVDIEKGFSASLKSWSAIIAGANNCETAEQIFGTDKVRISQILQPIAANPAEMCWHYYLAGLDSGFTYYGDALDDEVKPGLALVHAKSQAKLIFNNEQSQQKDPLIADQTPPSFLKLQRWPYNPGGKGWGMTTRWRPIGFRGAEPHSRDFYVWTLAHDISGVKSAKVYVRQSLTGRTSPLGDHLLYRGGPEVSPWKPVPMTRRSFDPAERGQPPQQGLNYFIQASELADLYWAKIQGFSKVLVDYYMESEDAMGNLVKSPISHVWVD